MDFIAKIMAGLISLFSNIKALNLFDKSHRKPLKFLWEALLVHAANAH